MRLLFARPLNVANSQVDNWYEVIDVPSPQNPSPRLRER